ncbi:MAG: type IV secretory system conjugative DNA transfer family protein [Sedimenticola sp.]
MNEYSSPIGANAQKQKRPNLFWLLLFVCIGVVLSLSAGTQYIAWQYSFSESLGPSLFSNVYQPWAFLQWSLLWYDTDRVLYQQGYTIVASCMGITFCVYILVFFFTRRRAIAHDSLHGTARWATQDEITEAGLLPCKGSPAEGVFVGGVSVKDKLLYLRHAGPEHILAFAPTRSGKGVALVIPTLLSWPHSAIVIDMKGENWALTAGWRQRHANNKVLRFDPADASGNSARFNPLSEIRIGEPQEVGDAQNLATIIADPDGKGLNDHWMKTGNALLVGVILHCLYKYRDEGQVATLTALSMFLSDPSQTMDDALQEMIHYRHLPTGTHPTVAQAARDMLNREDRERSSVHSTAVGFLTLYRDPLITRNTEVSDFCIADLMNHDQPVSLYLVVSPADLDRMRPLVRVVVTQLVRRLTESMAFDGGRSVAHYRHRLLLMLDEFPSLGKLEVVEQSLAYMAGYGIKAFVIVQDLSQLHKIYTRDESVLSACHVRIAFAPNKIETAELLSRMTGKTTVIKKSISSSGDRFGMVLGNVSESLQEIERPLLTADECMRLPAPKKTPDGNQIVEPGDMLIMPSGFNAIYGCQSLYFLDPVLNERSQIVAPEVCDRISPADPQSNDSRTDRAREQIDALFQA